MPTANTMPDSVSVFVVRHVEQVVSYLLEFKEKRGWWLPLKPLDHNKSISSAAKLLEEEDGIQNLEIKGIIGGTNCRTQTGKAVNLIYYAQAKNSQGYGSKQRWATLKEMEEMEQRPDTDESTTNHLLDQLPMQLASEYENNNYQLNLIPLSRYTDVYPSTDFLRSLDEQQRRLLQITGQLDTTVFQSLHEHFFSLTYPSTKMNYAIFKTLFDKSQARYWRAFSNGEKRLSFKNFLLGFAACDPNLPTEEARELITEFLFRFYKKGEEEFLTFAEMRFFINDLFKFGDNEDLIDAKLREYELQLGCSFRDGVTFETFKSILKIAGDQQVSNLVRLETPLVNVLGRVGGGGGESGFKGKCSIPTELKFPDPYSAGVSQGGSGGNPGSTYQGMGGKQKNCCFDFCNNHPMKNMSSNNYGDDLISEAHSEASCSTLAPEDDVAYSVEKTTRTYHTAYPLDGSSRTPTQFPGGPVNVSRNNAGQQQYSHMTEPQPYSPGPGQQYNTQQEYQNRNCNCRNGYDSSASATPCPTHSNLNAANNNSQNCSANGTGGGLAIHSAQSLYRTPAHWNTNVNTAQYYSNDPTTTPLTGSGSTNCSCTGSECSRNNCNVSADYSRNNISMPTTADNQNNNKAEDNESCKPPSQNLPYTPGPAPVYLRSPCAIPYQNLATMLTCGVTAKYLEPPQQEPPPPDREMLYSSAPEKLGPTAGAMSAPPQRLLRMPPPGAGSSAAGSTSQIVVCKKCQPVKYKLGYHVVDIKPTDEQMDLLVQTVDQVSAAGGKTAGSGGQLALPDAGDSGSSGTESNWNLSSVGQAIIDQLDKSFEGLIKLGQETHRDVALYGYAWDSKDEQLQFADRLLKLCDEVKPIFQQENRLLRLYSPIYVLGDLHGNFKDLKIFERMFWRHGPAIAPAKMLFCGDYVDRGQFGLEVCAYLFAQKLLCPHQVFILRGNHEDRFINGHPQYQFKAQCLKKLGKELGVKVWERVNEVFDCLPLAAVVDNSVFCVHGGIPAQRECATYDGTIESINRIPCPLTSVESNQTALQLLWNDPLPAKGTQDPRLNEELEKYKDGFCTNLARTGGAIDFPVKYFSTSALQEFLKKNYLEFIIRSHEVSTRGFYIRKQFKMLTVFASSFYCGQRSQASVILIDNARLRLLRVNTMDQHLVDESGRTDCEGKKTGGDSAFANRPACYPQTR